jgi:dimeric dUTPase (all-alpha-NTP-PPase superfamily)
MDNLTRLFELQAELQYALAIRGRALIGDHQLDVRQAEAVTKENALALMMEVAELMDSINWKPWRTWRPEAVNRDNLLVEVVDCFHFLLNICLTWGFAPDVIVAAFEAKHAENRARQERGY